MDLVPATVLATAVEGLLVVDRAGRFTYANPAAEKILGRPAAELAVSSIRAVKTAAIDGAPLSAEELPALRVMRTGERSAQSEHRVVRPDGSSTVVCHTATLIRGPGGGVEGAVASLLDISEKANVVPPPASPKELTFRAFVERSPDGVALYKNGRVVYANPALLRLLGFEFEEIAGRPVLEFVHPDDRAVAAERIRTVSEDEVEVPVITERLLHRDGHVVDVEVSSRPIAHNGEAMTLVMVVDVSERKRILRELDRSVSMLRATLDATTDGILVVDLEGRITTFNERFVEMWRIPRSIIESREDGKAIAYVLDQLVEPQEFLARMNQLYADTEAESFDRFALTDGRYYERHSLPQRLDGKPVGRVWSFRDITARKNAEDERERLLGALAAKHGLLDTVVRNAPVAICLLRGPDFVYELVNPAFEAILGHLPRIGRRVADVVPDPAEIVPALQRVLETGEAFHALDVDRPSTVLRGNHGELGEVYLWRTYVRVPCTTGEGVLVLLVDVSEQVDARRRNEVLAAVARRQAAELESVHRSMIDGIVACDARGTVTHVNEASGRLAGLDKSTLVGLSLEEYAKRLDRHCMNGERVGRAELALGRALAGETVVNIGSWSTRTGRKVYMRSNAAPVRDTNGGIVGAIAVERDVSDIIELDTMRDQFIRIAAHELKTPVAIMKGYADVLLRSSAELPEPLRAGAQAIDRGAKRIDRLVGDLLGVSQLLMGCLELRRERFELAELVDVVVRQIATTTKTHPIHIESEPVVVFADRVRLAQVLDTLLDNAIRYSPRGGVINVTVRVHEDEAIVCVRDHGVGIPRPKQARIFERFYRAHTDTPHDYGGMGVGLYIAREVIEQHGGRMWFESEEGSGSEFCFSLRI